MTTPHPFFKLCLGTALGVLACTSVSDPPLSSDDGESPGAGGAPVDGPSGDGGGDQGDGDLSLGGLGPGPAESAECGDGKIESGEACDDGNVSSGDGCGADCRVVEPGYVCRDEGTPCRAFAECGDGLEVFPEQCDDGNLEDVDGCSAGCKIELGWKCDDASPNSCAATVCGDNTQEGAETCDDGNQLPFDGCNVSCQAEPSCTSDECTSRCGDGLIIGQEQCDDGNAVDGDGCSSTCQEEEGYICEQGPGCPDGQEDCPLVLPIIFRDFSTSHPDFKEENARVPQCSAIVADMLDDNAKPVLATPPPTEECVDSVESFAAWYDSAASGGADIVSTMTFFPNGSDGYVNRFGPNGEQYVGLTGARGRRCGDPELQDDCGTEENEGECTGAPFDPQTETCWLVGDEREPGVPAQCCLNCFCAGTPAEENSYDGNPLFFPLDDHPDALTDERYAALIPQEIYGGGNNWEPPGDVVAGQPGPTQPLHNFHFTSEIAQWFEYEEGKTADLTFVGDDDVFVFVNRRLVLDLGGIHAPLAGRFALLEDGTIETRTWEPPDDEITATQLTAADLGMQVGGVYEIKVFHAERRPSGSTFQLTFSGFDTQRSVCRSICGDGILAAGEQCDLGEEQNVGGHNGCNPDCKMGAYCGDGLVEEGIEECDDADPEAPEGCAGCRILTIR